MLKFVFLSDSFRHYHAGCTEIEMKSDRPYVLACIRMNGYTYAIPMRSHIKHKYVLWTDEANGCGLDFSKTVVITNRHDIDEANVPHIRQNEFESLKGKEQLIRQKLSQYINTYKKAKARIDVPRNQTICKYSTLQYFEKYI